MSKSPFLSSTLWFNAAALVIAIADQVSPFIPPKFQPWLLSIVAVANFVNRFRTKQAVRMTKEE